MHRGPAGTRSLVAYVRTHGGALVCSVLPASTHRVHAHAQGLLVCSAEGEVLRQQELEHEVVRECTQLADTHGAPAGCVCPCVRACVRMRRAGIAASLPATVPGASA